MKNDIITIELADGTTQDYIRIWTGEDSYTTFPAVVGNPNYDAFLVTQESDNPIPEAEPVVG